LVTRFEKYLDPSESLIIADAYLPVLEAKKVPKSVSLRYEHLIEMLWNEHVLARREKGARWIGFIQGQLEFMGIYSIDDMRGHVTEARKISRGEATLDALKLIMEKEWKSPKI